MSTKERREREKLALRTAILKAAQEIAASEGWSAVSIRKIAERIEYSPPMVYEYFDDKEALLRTIKAEAFGQLLIQMQREREKIDNAGDGLLAIGQAYLDFAFANPALYFVMHGLGGVPFDTQINHDFASKPPEIIAVITFVMEVLQKWAAEQGVAFRSIEDAFFMTWSAMHGLIALYFCGSLPFDEAKVRALVRIQIESFITAWRITPP